VTSSPPIQFHRLVTVSDSDHRYHRLVTVNLSGEVGRFSPFGDGKHRYCRLVTVIAEHAGASRTQPRPPFRLVSVVKDG
jgi:hypothetical protein